MNAKQKRTLSQVVLAAVAGLFAWVVIFMNLNVTEESAAFVVRQHEWTNNFVANLNTHYVVYLLMAGGLGLGAYLLLGKKRKR